MDDAECYVRQGRRGASRYLRVLDCSERERASRFVLPAEARVRSGGTEHGHAKRGRCVGRAVDRALRPCTDAGGPVEDRLPGEIGNDPQRQFGVLVSDGVEAPHDGSPEVVELLAESPPPHEFVAAA